MAPKDEDLCRYLNGYGSHVYWCLRSSRFETVCVSADYLGLIVWDSDRSEWALAEPFILSNPAFDDEFYITDREAFLDWCKNRWGAEAVADFLLFIEET